MKIVNMHEAKTRLSQLVDQAENGEDVILARAGKPVARIVAIGNAGRRTLGQWRGRVRGSDELDAALPDAALAAWPGARP